MSSYDIGMAQRDTLARAIPLPRVKGRRYYTFKKSPPKAGYAAGDVIKLLAGQKLGFQAGLGYYARPGGGGGGPAPRGGAGGAGAGASRALTEAQMIQQYQDMLTNQQRGVLDALLADRRRQTQGEMAALGGFGAALQGYSHELWGQTGKAYQDAANAQQSAAAGLATQMTSGLANTWARAGELAAGLGHTGQLDLPSIEAAKAQIESEGGARTGDMMSQVGHAWGGYGATRPEYIGFMTGQNQMQLQREALEGDRDLQSEFLKLGMENPVTAFEMYAKSQENKRQNVSTSLAQKTLATNIAVQKAKIKQDYLEMRANAKTQAQKLALDRWYKEQNIAVDQQNAASSATRAGASLISANASATRAQTAAEKAAWDRAHPGQSGSAAKYTGGSYQQKVASAMGALPTLFERSGGNVKGKTDYAFGVLWGQMAPYIDPKNKARAKALLRQRISNAAKAYQPKPSSSGGGDDSW